MSRAAEATVGGTPVSDHDEPEAHPVEHWLESREVMRIGLVAVASAAVWLRLWEPLARVSVIGLTAALVGGYPIFEEAFSALRARRMTMELSMTIAVGAALAIGEFFTALVIVLFVLIAEVLERLTVGRGRRAIKDLLDFLPRQALVRRGGAAREVGAAEIAPGDVVVVRPGGRLPVDGVVVAGHSFVDQATITGESLPVEKVAGAHVYAGTINQSGALEVRAIRIGRDTAFGKIIEAVEAAERSRAPIQKTADRLAGYLVYFAIGCAALTFLITRDVRSTISVVIVAGRVRHRRRHAARDPRRDRPGGAPRGDRQGRSLPGGLEPGGHGGARQDRHPDVRRAGGRRHPRRLPARPPTRCSPPPPSPSARRSTRSGRRS